MLLVCAMICSNICLAQILDDTTKLMYGPNTTRYTTLIDIKQLNENWHHPDTSLYDFHKFTDYRSQQFLITDLGTVGTAITSIWPEKIDEIGTESGFNVYNAYFKKPTCIKFYDTQSPYSYFKGVIGGKGRTMLNAALSRNIRPAWNFGGDFRMLTIDKQINGTGRGDRRANGMAYDFYTHAYLFDSLYRVVASFSRMNHVVDESAGLQPLINDDYFEEDSMQVWLSNAESRDLRINYHLYHHAQVLPNLAIFHEFDQLNQVNYYTALLNESELAYYTAYNIPILHRTDTTMDRYLYRTFENNLGVKTSINGFYLTGSYRHRLLHLGSKYLVPTIIHEHYLNAQSMYRQGNFKIMLDAQYGLQGNYSFRGEAEFMGLTASVQHAKSLPSWQSQEQFGNHVEWYHDWEMPISTIVSANYLLRRGRWSLRPGIHAALNQQFIYYTTEDSSPFAPVFPAQSDSTLSTITPTLEVGMQFLKHFRLTVQGRYAIQNNTARLLNEVPMIFVNTNLHYQRHIFKDKLHFQVGVDAHYQSTYFGRGYQPILQNYFVQRTFKLPSFYLIDFYLSLRIGRARLFLKAVNVLNNEYFAAPIYLGQRRVIDAGFNWMFFD